MCEIKRGRKAEKARVIALLIGWLFWRTLRLYCYFFAGNELAAIHSTGYTVVGCPLIIMQYASHALASMLILLEARRMPLRDWPKNQRRVSKEIEVSRGSPLRAQTDSGCVKVEETFTC